MMKKLLLRISSSFCFLLGIYNCEFPEKRYVRYYPSEYKIEIGNLDSTWRFTEISIQNGNVYNFFLDEKTRGLYFKPYLDSLIETKGLSIDLCNVIIIARTENVEKPNKYMFFIKNINNHEKDKVVIIEGIFI